MICCWDLIGMVASELWFSGRVNLWAISLAPKLLASLGGILFCLVSDVFILCV